MVGKDAKNRATAQRTAREKDAGKMVAPSPQFPRVFFNGFLNSRLSPLSELLEQARLLAVKREWGMGG